MRHFSGQTVSKEIFHTPGVITLPVFKVVKGEVSLDGQIELDAIGVSPERIQENDGYGERYCK
jgi:hypothetical protein